MKKTSISLLKTSVITMMLMGLIFSSCKRKTNTITSLDVSSLKNMYANSALPVKNASITNSTGGEVIGNGGSRLIIQPNSFVYANGSLVTGDVAIQFADFTNRADMIFANILPISNGQPLISGGEYWLTAKQNGVTVRLAPGKTTQVNIPQFGNNSNNMIFFRGTPVDSNGINIGVNWVKQDSMGAGYVVYNGDTISIFDDSCSYTNADRFMANPTYCQFDINVSGISINDSSFTSYSLYKDYNGLWPMYSSNTGVIHATHIPDIPVHLVVFGYKDGEFYSGIVTDHMPVNNGSVGLIMQKSDPLTLKNLLKNL